MTIQERYERIRHEIGDGCIGLMSKKAFVSNLIRRHDRNFDGSKAEWSHVFSVYAKEYNGRIRLFVLDSNATGVKPAFLSDRIKACDNFMFLKPSCSNEIIQAALFDSFDRASKGIKYDYFNGFKELANRRYGFKFKIKPRDEHDICSDWCRPQSITQDMMLLEFALLPEPFPQDYDRYCNLNTVTQIR